MGDALDPARYGQRAIEFTFELDQLNTPEAIIAKMSAALGEFGYSSFLISTSPEVVAGTGQPYFLLNGWPPEWAEVYAQHDYYKDDPIATWCRQTVNPYEWSEVRYDPEKWPRAATVMNAATEFDLREGFVVPILHPDGMMGAVTMAGGKPDFDPVAKRAIHLISLYAHAKILSIVGMQKLAEQRRLSAGEREVLTWIAAGKGNWEISEILDIPESTVDWRVRNATKKLGAVTRTQAVATAIKAREIVP